MFHQTKIQLFSNKSVVSKSKKVKWTALQGYRCRELTMVALPLPVRFPFCTGIWLFLLLKSLPHKSIKQARRIYQFSGFTRRIKKNEIMQEKYHSIKLTKVIFGTRRRYTNWQTSHAVHPKNYYCTSTVADQIIPCQVSAVGKLRRFHPSKERFDFYRIRRLHVSGTPGQRAHWAGVETCREPSFDLRIYSWHVTTRAEGTIRPNHVHSLGRTSLVNLQCGKERWSKTRIVFSRYRQHTERHSHFAKRTKELTVWKLMAPKRAIRRFLICISHLSSFA